MALQHFIRVFVDSDGTAKGDVCHYDEAGKLTGTDPLDSRIVSGIQSLMVEGADPEPAADALPDPPAQAPKPRGGKTTKKEK